MRTTEGNKQQRRQMGLVGAGSRRWKEVAAGQKPAAPSTKARGLESTRGVTVSLEGQEVGDGGDWISFQA